jgi:hypothetical protein
MFKKDDKLFVIIPVKFGLVEAFSGIAIITITSTESEKRTTTLKIDIWKKDNDVKMPNFKGNHNDCKHV